MIIFEKKGKVTPDDDKTNIAFDFEVPEGAKKLVIEYAYSPKELEDRQKALELIRRELENYLGNNNEKAENYLPVKNLITLSLDENGKYRGAAHRQPNSQKIEISAENCTPGFKKGAPESGKWRIVLNVHCCVCDVDYEIKISSEVQ
ncbi:MAG: hypothetical protein ACLUH5_02840 [Eubacterium sp.]